MKTANFEPTWDAFTLTTALETTGVNIVLPMVIRATIMLDPGEHTVTINEDDAAFITSVKKDGVSEAYTLVTGVLAVAVALNKECLLEIERSGDIVYSIFAGQMIPGISLINGRLSGIVGNIPFTSTHTYRFGLRAQWGGLTADVVKTWGASPADNQLTWNSDTLPEQEIDATLVNGRFFYTLGEFRRGQTVEIGIDIFNPDATPIAVQLRAVPEMVSGATHFSGSLPMGLTTSNNPFVISGFIPAEALAGDYFVEAFIDEPFGPTPIILHAKLLGDQFDKGTAVNHLIWNSDADLGSATEGLSSTLSIHATNTGGGLVKYRLAAGSRQLPAGLVLNESGEIQGRVPHVYADTVILFSAKASSGAYVVQKQFTFRILRSFETARHVAAYLPLSGPTRRAWHAYGNQIDPNRLYRASDSNFGIPASRILLVRGLQSSPTTLDYDRPFDLIAGQFKLAQMMQDGKHICDVIYREFFDPKEHAGGFVTGAIDVIASPTYYPEDHSIQIFEGTVRNLRSDLVTKVGLNAPLEKQRSLGVNGGEVLDGWMTSRQIDGKPLGFVTAAVVAYILPDEGKYVIRSLTYGSVAIGAMVSFDRLLIEDGGDAHQYYFGWQTRGISNAQIPDAPFDVRLDGIPTDTDVSLHANPHITWSSTRDDVTYNLRFYNGETLLRTVTGLTDRLFIYTNAMQTQDGNYGRVLIEITSVIFTGESLATEAAISLKSGYGLAWGLKWG